MSADIADPKKNLLPGVPPPPSKEYVDQVSKDQALIDDEWAPAPPHPEKPDDVGEPTNRNTPL